jgi:hypothetical protein
MPLHITHSSRSRSSSHFGHIAYKMGVLFVRQIGEINSAWS